MNVSHPLVVIVGPTASGKTDLSIAIARRFNGACVNADATQLFAGLSIATNKIQDAERGGIDHYLLDILDLKDKYSVKEYQLAARNVFQTIWSRNQLPILVGGTGLYVNGAIKRYDFDQLSDDEEALWHQRLASKTTEQLWLDLSAVDASINVTSLHPHNRQRVIRALINYYTNSVVPSGKIIKKDEFFYERPPLIINLEPDRAQHEARIAQRVQSLADRGLVEEVKQAYVYCDNDLSYQSMQIIGVREVVEYLADKISWDTCFQLMCQANRRYAKKQRTWFSHQLPTAHLISFRYEQWTATIERGLSLVEKYLAGEDNIV